MKYLAIFFAALWIVFAFAARGEQRLRRQTEATLVTAQHALATAKTERDQFAAAFLKALAAEEACDEHFRATFEKRNYVGN